MMIDMSMNVCIITTTLDKKAGGPARSVPILAKGLSTIGVNVYLLSFKTDDMNLALFEGTNVNVSFIPKQCSGKKLRHYLIKNKIDLVHCQGVWRFIYNKICREAKRLGVPYIMTPRGALEPWCYNTYWWKHFKKTLAMALYQKTDLQESAMLLATSKMEADNLRRLGLVRPIAVIPNGIIMDDYPCRGLDCMNRIKKQVLFLSRIHPKKGIEILLDSWKQMVKSYPDWKLLIVGNGDANYINGLNEKIINDDLDNNVSILPPAFGKDKYNLYVDSSVFVLPTYSENFGMVIAEALSCGLPVITTTGTPWESINEEKAGWWIDMSKESLTETLAKAMGTQPEALYEMGQRGARMVRESYDYIQVSKKMELTYKWILKRGNVPDFVIL